VIATPHSRAYRAARLAAIVLIAIVAIPVGLAMLVARSNGERR
jgi:hypothetical protein